MAVFYDPILGRLRIKDVAVPVAALPTSGIVTGQTYRLTAADASLLAPIGEYVYVGNWFCTECFALYPLGNLGAAPSFAVIPGVWFSGVQNVNITTAPVFTFAGVGFIHVYKTGAFTVVGKCTMADRVAVEEYTDAWTPSGAAKSDWLIKNDGVNISSAATALV